jgi:hypothetical protein
MPGYLLLRDNKESGPYSLDDLLAMGLKAYDLVWVQGKSAAWRYPSEIEELKAVAPAVEEQPFDRFFKKESSPSTDSSAATPTPSNDSSNENNNRPDIDHNRYAPVPTPVTQLHPTLKKSVFVTLPGSPQVPVSTRPGIATPSKPVAPAKPLPVVSDNAPVEEPLETKYSQPLDEIKERYVRTLLDRKDKKSRQAQLFSSLKQAAAVLVLVGLGLAAGFYFKSGSKEHTNVAKNAAAQSGVFDAASNPDLPGSSDEQSPQQKDPTAPIESIREDNESPASAKKIKEAVRINEEQEPTTVRIRKETMLVVPKEKNTDFPSRSPQFPKQPLETDPITGQRNARVRNAADLGFEDKSIIQSFKNSLHDQVSVSSNDYKRVAFGGIRNLYLTVTNNSRYELDKVIVELQYLKPSEEPLRTENIRFHSIAPNGTSTVRVPDTNRGIKVNYRIINIEPKPGEGVALKLR